jgi:hypothetical protein
VSPGQGDLQKLLVLKERVTSQYGILWPTIQAGGVAEQHGRLQQRGIPLEHQASPVSFRVKRTESKLSDSDFRQRIIENLRSMPFAPSSQIRAVPSASVGQAIGSSTKGFVPDDDVDFELDSKIRGETARQTDGGVLLIRPELLQTSSELGRREMRCRMTRRSRWTARTTRRMLARPLVARIDGNDKVA